MKRNADILATFGPKLPAGVSAQHERLRTRVEAAAKKAASAK